MEGREEQEQRLALAKQFQMPIYNDLSSFLLSKELYKKISYSFVKKHTVLPISMEKGTITVAVADPLNLEPLEELKHMLHQEVKPVYSPESVIQEAIHACYNQKSGAASELIAEIGETTEEGRLGEMEVYDLLDTSKEQDPIVRLLNLIITEAIQQSASDIHFEPFADGMKVRYRIDGVLLPRHAPPPEYQAQMITRIKVISKLDIAERRLPQDGRIKLKMGRREIDFRVSTVPVTGGERIVMRILDKGNVVLGLNQIGMSSTLQEEFRKLVSLPEGIVLVTGPTGSGKTTTLYSAISELASDDVNIMTIEDPVEYNLAHIAQIGVRPKIDLTFAAGLRHILRQDPDIIMIGEIRDVETAGIAIQASLTGHLVLSTLHTNDAPSAITRMVDMGIEPYLLSSSVVGVLAQRLVRTICPNCKETYRPTPEEVASLGLTADQKKATLWRGKGCSECFETGFRGRQAIYELMNVTNTIHRQIVKSADAIEMRKAALASGMRSMLDYGAALVLEGTTTVAEILRVTRGVEAEE